MNRFMQYTASRLLHENGKLCSVYPLALHYGDELQCCTLVFCSAVELFTVLPGMLVGESDSVENAGVLSESPTDGTVVTQKRSPQQKRNNKINSDLKQQQ